MKCSNRVVLHDVVQATSYKEKLIGLLGTKEPKKILYFKTRWGIHTFGMRYTIDVIICDDNFIVQVIKRNLKPWRIFLWNTKYENVFELPIGTIKEHKIKLHDTIIFS